MPPEGENHLSDENYVLDLRRQLDRIHEAVRESVIIKSERVKSAYDQKLEKLEK